MQIKNFQETIELIKPYLGSYLEEKGINVDNKFNCIHPKHSDSTPSANLVGDNKERIYCHGCGRHFDIFDAVAILDKKPAAGIGWVQDTLKWLCDKYNVEFVSSNMSEEDSYRLDVHRAYLAAFEIITTDTLKSANQAITASLEERGWLKAIPGLQEWGIGTVSNLSDFQEALEDQGFDKEFLEEINLLKANVFAPNNLIFTWLDENRRPVGFTARRVDYKKGDDEGKYINLKTSGLKYNLFNKSKRLFGLDEAISAERPLYIFEGQADVITARVHGMMNCVALAGSSFRDDHVALLRYLGLTDIVLCLDGDKTGQEKTQQIVEEKLAGLKDIRVRVITMPPGYDPDSFIRDNSISEFYGLKAWTAFEWRLNKYPDDADDEQICEQMIPLILNEPSRIAQETMAKVLSNRTGYSLQTITAQINAIMDERSNKKNEDRQRVLDKIIHEMKKNPSEAELILTEGQALLTEVSKKHNSEILSKEHFLGRLDEQKVTEETAAMMGKWFNLGHELKELEDALRGDWSNGVWFCLGGKPNHGKTAFLTKLAYEIAKNNEDAIVLYHSIDDTAEQIIPRLVCVAEGSQSITMNMVHQPTYWSNTVGIPDLMEKRASGYSLIRELVLQGRLIVKDIEQGSSLVFAEALISHYQERYPDRRIVYILDNFHKLNDFAGADERVRFKSLSQAAKGLALRKKCCVITTVEYTKLLPGIKPNNNNIAETQQIEYDANLVLHLYNEVADIPDRFTVCNKATNWKGDPVFYPRPEMIIGKNKVTDIKETFFLDFYPGSSDYKHVSREIVLQDSKAMEDFRKGGYNNKPKDEVESMFS